MKVAPRIFFRKHTVPKHLLSHLKKCPGHKIFGKRLVTIGVSTEAIFFKRISGILSDPEDLLVP